MDPIFALDVSHDFDPTLLTHARADVEYWIHESEALAEGAGVTVGVARTVRPATGPALRCRGWRQEGLLRMLENTVAIGERPADLVIYGGAAQAARNWDCYDTIVATLRDLGDDETLLMQSGKPVARFRTTLDSPRVLTSSSQLVPRWATWDVFHDLQARGLMMYGQYTAGAWQYIGRQGILQSTYETLAECARQNFGGTLRHRIVLTAGLGAMGSAQPLAVEFLGGVSLICEVDEAKVRKSLDAGYLRTATADIGEAVRLVNAAARSGDALSVALHANAADALPRLYEMGLRPDIVTDQTAAHDALDGYIPAGYTVGEATALRSRDPDRYQREALASIRTHLAAMLAYQDTGSVVFEYGNAIREQAARAGHDGAFGFSGFVPLYVRPNLCVARGACRWLALSGDPADIETIDRAMLERFAGDASITDWIGIAMARVPHQGLPARTSWLDYRQRLEFATMVNGLVAAGALAAPVAMSRDHLDAGSVAQPTRETENMLDGSDAVADWPVLNALVNTAAGGDLVALHQGGGSGMGGSVSAGLTIIIDGTDRTQARLDRVLRTDPGLGVIRHADAGYPASLAAVAENGLAAPMLPGPGHPA